MAEEEHLEVAEGAGAGAREELLEEPRQNKKAAPLPDRPPIHPPPHPPADPSNHPSTRPPTHPPILPFT